MEHTMLFMVVHGRVTGIACMCRLELQIATVKKFLTFLPLVLLISLQLPVVLLAGEV